MADVRENVIEWLSGDDRIACTFTQQRYITKVRALVEAYRNQGDDRADIIQNPDGSVFCHLPIEALKLRGKSTRVLSEEQIEAAKVRLAAARIAKAKKGDNDAG